MFQGLADERAILDGPVHRQVIAAHPCTDRAFELTRAKNVTAGILRGQHLAYRGHRVGFQGGVQANRSVLPARRKSLPPVTDVMTKPGFRDDIERSTELFRQFEGVTIFNEQPLTTHAERRLQQLIGDQ